VNYSVYVAANGPEFRDAWLEDLADVFVDLFPETSPVAGWGGVDLGPHVQLSIEADQPLEAAHRAVEVFGVAVDKAGIPVRDIVHVEVMTAEVLDRLLNQELEGFVGVREIAELLQVSKQRVVELRGREDFPRPVAELAAGPVWTRSSLNHFIAAWPRKSGRPRKSPAGSSAAAG
jgi:hypothetical protein